MPGMCMCEALHADASCSGFRLMLGAPMPCHITSPSVHGCLRNSGYTWKMRTNKLLLAFGLIALFTAAPLARAQTTPAVAAGLLRFNSTSNHLPNEHQEFQRDLASWMS